MEKLSVAETNLEKAVESIINNENRNFIECIEEILEHGCISGLVSSLVYYEDTNNFYDKYEDEIWDLIIDYQENFGYKNPFEFLSTLSGSNNVGNNQQFKNLLTWFAFEETAKKLLERYYEKYSINNINL